MKLIVEHIDNVKFLTEDIDGVKKHFIEGIFIQGNKKNKNDRIYPIDTLKKEVARYLAEMVGPKRAFGELGHPDGPNINLDRVSHLITSLVQEGDDFVGKAKILDTPNGRIVKSLLDEGAQLGVSTRGLGSLRRASDGFVVQDDFVLAAAADIVADPSAPDAFVRGIMESREWVWDNGIIKEANVAAIRQNIIAAPKKKSAMRQDVFVEQFGKFLNALTEDVVKPADVEINTRRFVASHRQEPRGMGYWGFLPTDKWNRDDYLDFVWWYGTQASYGAAKVAAQQHFAKLGITDVMVAP